jgi:hypothetical protein
MIRLFVPIALAALTLQSARLQRYADPGGRFTFSYPSAWGAFSPGTNNGFRDRLVAIGFSAFPSRFKGEAVLSRGFPLIDLQAAGGLYDGLTLEIFPESLRARILDRLPHLTLSNLCDALRQSTHMDPNLPAFASLTPAERQALSQVDAMRNANPRLVECRTDGDTIVFDKERSFRRGDPIQHVYGAVRFLPEPYSTFQLIAGGDVPDRLTLTAIAGVVASFTIP